MKTNKKQKDAVEYLVYDLDELSNKPRRLFGSLKSFAEAFLAKGKLNEVLDDLDEFKNGYYKNIGTEGLLADIYSVCKNVKKKSLSRNELEMVAKDYYGFSKDLKKKENEKTLYLDGYEKGAKTILEKIRKDILDYVIEYYDYE